MESGGAKQRRGQFVLEQDPGSENPDPGHPDLLLGLLLFFLLVVFFVFWVLGIFCIRGCWFGSRCRSRGTRWFYLRLGWRRCLGSGWLCGRGRGGLHGSDRLRFD